MYTPELHPRVGDTEEEELDGRVGEKNVEGDGWLLVRDAVSTHTISSGHTDWGLAL